MPDPVSLPLPEATCLEQLRAGFTRHTTIALRSGHGDARIQRALLSLADLRLARKSQDGSWKVTARGRTVPVSLSPARKTRGRTPQRGAAPTGTAARLLTLLETPRHRADLPGLLGVTRERVRQLLVFLSASGRIRGAGSEDPNHALALTGDPVVLLTYAQERVLSAFEDDKATTLSRLALVAHRGPAVMADIARFLCEAGLIERLGTTTRGELWRLTPLGRSHWQRSRSGPKASEPPLTYRSDRIAKVLAYLMERGEARTVEVARALGVPAQSMNALMQYLKRRKLVRLRSDAYQSPYVVTDEGRELRAALTRRAEAQGSGRDTPSGKAVAV